MTPEKIVLGLAALVVLISGPASTSAEENLGKASKDKARWGKEVEGFKLSAEANKNRYRVGEKVDLVVTLKNVSREEARIVVQPPVHEYSIQVILPNGESAAHTVFGKQELDKPVISRATVLLSSQEERSVSLFLNRIFDMSLAGDYKITVSTEVWARKTSNKFATVTSNTLVLRIEEGSVP